MSDSGMAVDNKDDQVAEQTPDSSAEEPLPRIPDGGLATAMPVWLQQAPGRPVGESSDATVDVASLAKSLELPPWLSALSERVEAGHAKSEPEPAPVAVAEPPAPEPAPVVEEAIAPVVEEQGTHRPLGSSVLAAQQSAADRVARPAKLQLPPIPAAVPVDAEEFLRGGEITVAPEPRSRLPFVIAAVLLVVLAAAAVWYFGA